MVTVAQYSVFPQFLCLPCRGKSMRVLSYVAFCLLYASALCEVFLAL